MKKFTYYTILQLHYNDIDEATERLNHEVQKYLKIGWVPQGGISISISKHGSTDFYTLAQAMVKVKEE